MKNIAIFFMLIGLVVNGQRDPMDASAIKQMLRQMEASYPKATLYHVDYTVTYLRTDAYYQRRKALIAMHQELIAKEGAEAQANGTMDAFKQRQQHLENFSTSYQREMTYPRENTVITDYSVDGTGFFVKQTSHLTKADGTLVTSDPSIYVSNGKLMGTFYPNGAQGVIEPATERPALPTEYWLDIAYQYYRRGLAACFEKWVNFKMSQTADEIIISAENPGAQKATSYAELHIDKASLMPIKIESTVYSLIGEPYFKSSKTWRYENFSGVKLPQTVVDQTYYVDLKGNWNLEEQQTMTINQFTLIPLNASDEFATLLKANYSIFDEITGTHYLSGSAATMLDNLSK